MTTQEVATRLVELCRANKHQQAIEELYHPEIISVEPEGSPFGTIQGLAAIAEKGKQYEAMVESFNSSSVSDPIVAENFFSCNMLSNVNMKGVPVPVDMDEICVYTVKEGKIVKEQFFYTVPTQQ